MDGRDRGLLWKHGRGRWHANAIFGRLFERLGADLSEAVKSSMIFSGVGNLAAMPATYGTGG